MTSYNFQNPFLAPLVQRTELSAALSLKKAYQLVLDLKGSDLTFKPGDCAAVLPQNDPAIVEKLLQMSRHKPEETFFDPRFKTSFSFQEFLTYRANLATITSKLLKLFYLAQEDQTPKTALEELLNHPEKLKNYQKNHQLIDLFSAFYPPKLALSSVLSELLPLRARLYSISSSLKYYPEKMHLSVSYVTYTTELGQKRQGVASHFLTQLAQVGDMVPLYIQNTGHFLLPPDSRPIIMIAAGAGIAPFIAFLQERKMLLQEPSLSKEPQNWLFFGERKKSLDFYYKDFLTELETEKFLKLTTAFSRDQEEKIYVQNRLLEHQEELWSWIKKGANIYLCGNAKLMGKDAEEALKTIVQNQAGISKSEAKTFLSEMAREKRYLKDVY
ncbi:MAG: hypothetical protein WC371_01410 [Parachlamydiales bacterium]|jgi:sulfite reductase (NADPH) flavoprotein alpha-component